LGTKIVERFLSEGMIYDIGDIYYLDFGEIAALEGFGEKSADNLHKEIEKSKEQPLWRLLNAISIPGVGAEAAKLLEKHFRSFDAVASASADELVSIKGIGPKMAEKIVDFFNDAKELETIGKLRHAGLKGFKKVKETRLVTGGKFEGKTFVITGTIEGYSRDDLKARIEELGGKVSGSISSKTDFLVLGAEPGSKLAKAQKVGTNIIEGKEIYRLLEIPEPG
jgi:DNA ligase (NAD+)